MSGDVALLLQARRLGDVETHIDRGGAVLGLGFRPAAQLSTTVNGLLNSTGSRKMNRLPSPVTAYWSKYGSAGPLL